MRYYQYVILFLILYLINDLKLMNSKTILTKSLLLFVLLASACKKDNTPPDNSALLKGKVKEERVLISGNYKFSYDYDENQQIKAQKFWIDDVVAALNEYTFLKGKLYFRVYSLHAGTGAAMNEESVTKYTFTGNQLTLAVENVLARQGEESDIVTRFTYDEQGFIKSTRQESTTAEGSQHLVINLFTVDENGNILKIRESTYFDGKFAKRNTYTMEYDDKQNPRYNLINPLEYAQYFSPNNVVELTEKTSEEETSTQFLYQYNSAQKPASMDANDVVKTEFRHLVKWVYY